MGKTLNFVCLQNISIIVYSLMSTRKVHLPVMHLRMNSFDFIRNSGHRIEWAPPIHTGPGGKESRFEEWGLG